MTATNRTGRTVALAVLGALFVLALLALLAVGGGGMMGTGGFGMVGGWMFVVPLLLLGLVILLVVAFADRDDAEPTDSALETLRRRYARGELTEEEYEARRRTLEDRSDG